jgi:hypothetical protein
LRQNRNIAQQFAIKKIKFSIIESSTFAEKNTIYETFFINSDFGLCRVIFTAFCPGGARCC